MGALPAPTNLLEAMNGMPLPQSQDLVQGGVNTAQGRNGTSLVMHGRVWQVGSGATTTSIPILDSNGLPVLMSASMQALYTQAKFEIVQAGTVELAVVTAVASNGTLTLDSPLSSAPSAGTAFLLTPTQQTSLTGSNTTFFGSVAPQSTDQNIQLGFTSHKVMVKNDGSNSINFTLNGTSSTGLPHPYTDSAWVYSGTWSIQTVTGISGLDGTSTKATSTASSTATFKPNTESYGLTVQYAQGTQTGTLNVQLSQDGGTTWNSPSAIAGVTRSDGATGTGLNAFTTVSSSPNDIATQTYYLPYPSNNWAIQLTFSSGNFYLTGGLVIDTGIFIVNPSENLELDVATNQINISSPTSTTGRVYAI